MAVSMDIRKRKEKNALNIAALFAAMNSVSIHLSTKLKDDIIGTDLLLIQIESSNVKTHST